MASRHLSLRVSEDMIERLDAESERSGYTRSELAKTLIEEGLRMEQHPRIVFRDGPAGRRAGLSDGPDVWEVASVFLSIKDGDPIERMVVTTSLRPDQIRRAMRYYADYPDEIDERIRRNDEAAERAHAEWLRERELLHG